MRQRRRRRRPSRSRSSRNRSSRSSSKGNSKGNSNHPSLIGQKGEGGRSTTPAPPHKKQIRRTAAVEGQPPPPLAQTSQEQADRKEMEGAPTQTLEGVHRTEDPRRRTALPKPGTADLAQRREGSKEGLRLRTRPQQNHSSKCSPNPIQHASRHVFLKTQHQYLPRPNHWSSHAEGNRIRAWAFTQLHRDSPKDHVRRGARGIVGATRA